MNPGNIAHGRTDIRAGIIEAKFTLIYHVESYKICESAYPFRDPIMCVLLVFAPCEDEVLAIESSAGEGDVDDEVDGLLVSRISRAVGRS